MQEWALLCLSCLGISELLNSVGLCLLSRLWSLQPLFLKLFHLTFSPASGILIAHILGFFVLLYRPVIICSSCLSFFSLYCSYLALIHIRYFCWNLICLQLEFDLSSDSLTVLSFLFCCWTHQVSVYVFVALFFSSKIPVWFLFIASLFPERLLVSGVTSLHFGNVFRDGWFNSCHNLFTRVSSVSHLFISLPVQIETVSLLCVLSNFGSYPEIFKYYKDLDLVKCCGECWLLF